MRLTVVDNGHRLPARLFMGMTGKVSGTETADVLKTLLYRPEILGRPVLTLAANRMRGPSFWTAGEREYIAASTATWHQCPFCIETHTELVRVASGGDLEVRPELATALTFLEAVSLRPDEPVTRPELPEQALIEAREVNLIWNIVNRLGNAFGFVLREGQLVPGTRALHRFRYRMPGFVTAGRVADPVAELRRLVRPVPGEFADYAALVRDASYKITDATIDQLKGAGHSEDEIFEITVSAATGAALDSYDKF
jgi:AhpD family alkylhydroperoxidase